jgi:WD40 repeat protein
VSWCELQRLRAAATDVLLSLVRLSHLDAHMEANALMQMHTCEQGTSADSFVVSEATCLARSREASVLAAGYSDGCIRLFPSPQHQDSDHALCSLNGHTRAITALAFSADGSLLASGSQDTEVVVWDVVAEAGLFRLRSHTGQITALAFLKAQKKLLSTSKDATLRVWDMVSQHCVQQIMNQDGACCMIVRRLRHALGISHHV